MADDIEIGGPSLGYIAAPSAADRVALSTGPANGGYSYRSDFLARIGGRFTGNVDGNGYGAVLYLERLSTGTAWQAASIGLDPSTALTYFNSGGSANGGFVWQNTSELMRLSSGGNLGVGVAPAARLHAKSTTEIMRLETVTPRGSGGGFFAINDPTGRKCFIGYGGGDDTFYIGNELNTSIFFQTGATLRAVLGAAGFWPGADNTYSLGLGGNRWSVVYSNTGAISTCDIRFKTFRADPAPREAELRAALRAVDELGFYQFNDAIAEKGPDEARWHFGPRAQAVWAIFADESLCPALTQREPGGDWLPPEGSIPPAFLCFDEWGEETAPVMAWWRPSDILDVDGQPAMVPCEEGEEGTEQRPTGETYVTRPAGNRFGVRIDQLHSLMIAALNAERLAQATVIASMETRLAALELAA